MDSFMYLYLSTEMLNYPIFGIRQQEIRRRLHGKNKKNKKNMQENGVAALKTLCFERNKYVQLRIL